MIPVIGTHLNINENIWYSLKINIIVRKDLVERFKIPKQDATELSRRHLYSFKYDFV